MKKKITTITLCVAIVLGLSGCGQIATLENGQEIVASVDGKDFTAEDLYEELKAQGGQTVLTNMIDEFILNEEYETDEDAETYAESQIESYRSSYESYGQDFDEALVSAGYEDEDDFKDALIIEYKKELATEDYVKDNLTDAEIEKYYEDDVYGDINVKHILISPETDDDMTDEEVEEAEEAALEEAEEIIKKLDKGEDFEELAKEYSDDSGTAEDGGALTASYGDVVDEFWEAADELEDGEYTSEPVESEYGYHIIYRVNQEDKPSLEDSKDDIIDALVDEKIEEDSTLQTQALMALREEYGLVINDDELESDYNDAMDEALSSDE